MFLDVAVQVPMISEGFPAVAKLALEHGDFVVHGANVGLVIANEGERLFTNFTFVRFGVDGYHVLLDVLYFTALK